MWALVTGASSGIGRDMSRYLYKLGYSLILVARDENKMLELKEELEKYDGSSEDTEETSTYHNSDYKATKENDNCYFGRFKQQKQSALNYMKKRKSLDIDILVNNAGFGVFGEFSKTDLGTEINLINTNITAVHILTKLYLQDMIKKNKGHILNVASIAGMEPGPLMAAYYASKAYVIRLSRAINKELRKDKSNVKISILCPGPTNTNFNNVANVVFKSPSMSSEKVAKYGIDKTLQGKLIIVPGILNKSVRLFSKIVPDSILETCAYHIQRRKRKQEK